MYNSESLPIYLYNTHIVASLGRELLVDKSDH